MRCPLPRHRQGRGGPLATQVFKDEEKGHTQIPTAEGGRPSSSSQALLPILLGFAPASEGAGFTNQGPGAGWAASLRP